MGPAKAVATVKSHIRGIIERENHSPTLVRIFEAQINQAIISLRKEFVEARDGGQTKLVWPRMVKSYVRDDDDAPSPVWGPIKDEEGRIMGLRVIPRVLQDDQDKLRKPRKLRIEMEWHTPEPD